MKIGKIFSEFPEKAAEEAIKGEEVLAEAYAYDTVWIMFCVDGTLIECPYP